MAVDSPGGPGSVLPVPVLRVNEPTDALPELLAAAGLPIGRPVVVVVGGAAGMAPSVANAIDAVLRKVVIPVVERLAGTVVDGGTDSGVMRSMGRARAASDARFPLVGVAVAATVIDGAEEVVDDAAPMEPNHTLVMLVPGSGWGGEVAWIGRVASAIARESPSVTILVNGGEIAYDDVAASLRQGRPVLVLAGTGRAADAIAAARRFGSPDPRTASIASSPFTLIAEVDDPDAVRTALEHLLSGKRCT